MTDQEILEKAYQAKIEELCVQLFNTLLNPSDTTPEADAERFFQRGLTRVREIRDRAST